MIDTRAVLDVVEAAARLATTVPVDLHTASDQRAQQYVVIEAPPGSDRHGGLGCPEADATIVVRVRSVARHSSPKQAARAASSLVVAVTAALLDRSVPLTGTGWEVAGRAVVGDAGVDTQGDLANAVIDVALYVVAKPTP